MKLIKISNRLNHQSVYSWPIRISVTLLKPEESVNLECYMCKLHGLYCDQITSCDTYSFISRYNKSNII